MIWLCPKGHPPTASKVELVTAAPHCFQYPTGQRQGRQRQVWLAMQTCWIVLGLAIPAPVLSSPAPPTASCPIQNAASNAGQLIGQPTGQPGNVVVLGRSQSRRYVVVVPTDQNALDDKTMLLTVRQCVPQAFVTSSGQGLFIYAGAYAKRDIAEGVAAALRSRGMDARVVYFR